ncbi:MAG: GntR family transcriptional regulator [Oscillospiraceae bacterium]
MNELQLQDPILTETETDSGNGGDASRPSKQSVAYSYLRTAIITGRFPPEKPLVEREICDKLGVSRTPVREALRRLGSEGLVDFVPNRGVFVAALSKEKAAQLYEMKEALEGMAARLCAERASEDALARMAECIALHRSYAENGEFEIAVDLDLRFHVILVESCGNPLIEQHAKSLLLQTRRLSQLAVYDTDQMEQFIRQHQTILDSIRNHDVTASIEAVSRHIRFVEQFQWDRWGMLF